jgi:hypothetical protein
MKINMEHSCIQLNDLPDEILVIILKTLNNVEVLYSLMDVNKRLNKIVYDPIFTSGLALMIRTSQNPVDSLPNPMLDRFCLRILPTIHHTIKSLYLESLSMERILRATSYPNVSQLGLFNVQETAINLFTGKIFHLIYKSRIHLNKFLFSFR